jgi:hypothetical protein
VDFWKDGGIALRFDNLGLVKDLIFTCTGWSLIQQQMNGSSLGFGFVGGLSQR